MSGSVNSSTGDRIRLTTQSHPFAGAVLSPKHAQELTPSLCLAIASALAQQQQNNQQQLQHHASLPQQQQQQGNSSSIRRLASSNAGITTIAAGSASVSSSTSIGGTNNNNNNNNTSSSSNGPAMVPYTLWITEAWRVLGWAEPSAALFWEMATMYHTLLVANRAYTNEYFTTNTTNTATVNTGNNTIIGLQQTIHGGINNNNNNNNANSHYIPPILSCGSASSVGSGTNNSNMSERMGNNSTTMFFPPSSSSAASGLKSKYSTVASAKELPVWLVGTYLLLHCEDYAHQRNLAGQDDRRFMSSSSSTTVSTSSTSDAAGGSTSSSRSSSPVSGSKSSSSTNKMDFTALLRNTTLSPRMRLHAGWNNDTSHCTAYVLRHLRKILLLAGLSNNPDAIRALIHLAAIPSTQSTSSTMTTTTTTTTTTTGTIVPVGTIPGSVNANTSNIGRALATTLAAGGGGAFSSSSSSLHSANDLRRQHDDEHGNVGIGVRLTVDDLEHLDFILQPPSGGGIDDPPIRIGEYLWNCIISSSSSVSHHSSSATGTSSSIALGDVERVVRQHLEIDLAAVGLDHEEKDDLLSSDDEDDDGCGDHSSSNNHHHQHSHNRGRLGGSTSSSKNANSTAHERERAKQPKTNRYQKELSYTNLRGTTIILKPNPPESMSSGVSMTGSVDQNYIPTTTTTMISTISRLHDLVISDCSDAHFYLLQPFEHATIAACSNCTIVVGAVAGLLHVVDCDKTNVTSAARRILTSNSCDVQLCAFSPSPPLFVGDNRTCQMAPYNTFYDGLHDDLLATGLAMLNPTPVLPPPETLSPYHSGMRSGIDYDNMWPQLQKASNKWKQPVELSKLEVPQVPGSPIVTASGSNSPSSVTLSPGADDKAMSKSNAGNDAALSAPILLPPSEFNVLFVPIEGDASRQRRLDAEDAAAAAAGTIVPMLDDGPDDGSVSGGGGGTGSTSLSGPGESNYCRLLSEILHLSPFRLPPDYERRVLIKAERMNTIQAAVRKKLTVEQQRRFEEELNRGFRDWLVTSGNLRQVLDLVHLERRGGI